MRTESDPVEVSPEYGRVSVSDGTEANPMPEDNPASDKPPSDEIPMTPEYSTHLFRDNDLLPLFRINPDTVGWLSMEGTRIDYPVVKGMDNEYYLANGFDKEPNVAGSIFMDSRNIGDGSDRHTLIYGHRMKDGSMFRDLEKYQDDAFYQSHRAFDLQTLHGTFRYRIFSAYVTDTDFPFIRTRFEDDEYQIFLGQIQERNTHPADTEIKLTPQSRILTLATCSRAFEDARFVVHAVLLEE